MRILPLLCPIMAAGLIAGCASAPKLVHMPVHPRLSEQGRMVIAEPVDRALLSTLVIDYINLFRSKYNLSILTYEHQASKAAFWMSEYQAKAGAVSHVAKASGMTRMGDRYRNAGGGSYACGYENTGWYPLFNPATGRNLTYDEMARSIVDGWINSADHFKNLTVKAEGEGYIGLGIARGSLSGLSGIYSTMNVFFYLPQWEDYSDLNKQSVTTPPAAAKSAQGAATTSTKKETTKKKTTKSSKTKKR
jgi:uncharacterized protein YkwD